LIAFAIDIDDNYLFPLVSKVFSSGLSLLLDLLIVLREILLFAEAFSSCASLYADYHWAQVISIDGFPLCVSPARERKNHNRHSFILNCHLHSDCFVSPCAKASGDDLAIIGGDSHPLLAVCCRLFSQPVNLSNHANNTFSWSPENLCLNKWMIKGASSAWNTGLALPAAFPA
jgi:hypothetical protein